MLVENILDLPFRERPVLELLNLAEHRDEPQRDYAGYGWARVPEIWLEAGSLVQRVTDALVLALHTPDDAAPGELELYFELEAGDQVSVDATLFLAKWLPRLPPASAIVLALCNPHDAPLQLPTIVPVYYALGDVESWLDHDEAGRIVLVSTGSWARLPA